MGGLFGGKGHDRFDDDMIFVIIILIILFCCFICGDDHGSNC